MFTVRRSSPHWSLSALFAALLIGWILPPAARAATFTVATTTDDPNDPTSLRAAINGVQASTDTSDTITIAANGTVSLVNGELALSNPNGIVGKSVTINGPGAGSFTVSGNRNSGNSSLQTRVFHFSGLSVTMSGLTVTQGLVNTGSEGGAGVLLEGGALTLAHCAITSSTVNTTPAVGGGIANQGGALSLTHCVLSSNICNGEGGAGGVGSRDGSLTLNNCTVNANSGFSLGGGINSLRETLILTRCTITSNTAVAGVTVFGYGGGVYSEASSATLTDCTISGNSANDAGDGVYVSGGNATLRGCTLSGNAFGGGFLRPTRGGGLCSTGATVSLTNCTVTGNNDDTGGGVYNTGALNVTDCTVVNNGNGGTNGEGLFNDTGGTATVTSTILTGNHTFNGESNVATVTPGAITSGGSNLVGDPDGNGFVNDPNHADPNSAGNHDQTGVNNPLLGPLQNNGGLTQTMALRAGSPAIDGDFADATPTDQRGAPRPFGPRSDIGAFESGATPPATTVDTYIVTNTNDDGAGSLRRAINNADADPGAAVVFDPSVFGPGMPQTITLTSGQLSITQSMTVTGPGQSLLTIDGSHMFTDLSVGGTGTVNITGLTFTNGGNSGVVFGSFSSLAVGLTDCTITGNMQPNSNSGGGGGLFVGGGLQNLTATLTRCVITNNSAPSSKGGGVAVSFAAISLEDCTIAGNSAPQGGGLSATFSLTTTVGTCTISGNTATLGGGVYNDGGGTLLAESTVSGNTATTGGGAYNTDNGFVEVINSTVSANAAGTGSGLYTDSTNGSFAVNSILAGNTGGSNVVNNSGNAASLSSFGSNLIGDPDGNGFVNDPNHADPNSAGNHDQTGVNNPLLGPLQNNGGLTQTMALLAGSPAIDGDFNGSGGADQRGAPRPQGARNDIGAYEYGIPVAQADAYSLGENTTLMITAPGVLVNDTSDGAALTAVVQTQPSHGTLQNFGADGSFTYKPNTDFLGTDAFTYQAQDAGGQGGTATVTLTVTSALAPTTTATVSGPAGSNGFYRGPVTVTLTATDNSGSDPISTFYAINGGPQQTYTAPFPLNSDGIYTITYLSQDAAGRTEPTQSLTVKIDGTPPVTTVQAIGPMGNNGYFTGQTGVGMTVTDATAGVATVTYALDGAPPTTITVAGFANTYIIPGVAFTIADGTHTVTYNSTDNAGNVEPAKSITITIDATPPTLTFGSPTPAPNASGWNNGPVTIPYATADATSGVASAVPGNAVVFSAEGKNQTQTVTVTDNAGNSAQFISPPVNIDLTPPVTSATSQSTTTGQQVTLSATDTLSGVASTTYSLDGGAQTPYTAPFTVSANGPHTITYASTDTAGNAEASKTLTFTVNLAAPITTATLAGPQGTNGWYTGTVTVTLSAQAKALPVARTVYTLDGGPQTTYTAPFQITGDARHTLTYFSTDTAGNAEATNTIPIAIDSTPPVTTASTSGSKNSTGAFTGTATVTLSATDALSGVAATTYSVDGGASTSYTGGFSVSGTGSHTVTYHSTDNAGNVESARTLSLTIAPSTPPGARVLHTFGAGLQMLSVPESYPSATAAFTLPPSKFAVWHPTLVQYTLSGPEMPLALGQGYWARPAQSADLLDTGTPADATKPFSITLSKGWNMIGDPFFTPVSLADISVRPAGAADDLAWSNATGVVSSTLYAFPAGSSQYQTLSGVGASLQSYTGYWVYAFEDASLIVSPTHVRR